MGEGAEQRPLTDLTVGELLAAVGRGTPAPGGGATSALAAAMGAALARMVIGLTLGRPKYAAVQAQMEHWHDQAFGLQARLERLAGGDTAAYSRVIEAYKLPKDTDAERAARERAVQKALRGAAEVPINTAAACVELLQLLEKVTGAGNPNASGDGAVGALLTHAALRGAARNVRINLRQITDEDYVRTTGEQIAALVQAGEAALAGALTVIDGGY